jgi:hypothetical protein
MCNVVVIIKQFREFRSGLPVFGSPVWIRDPRRQRALIYSWLSFEEIRTWLKV